MDIARQLHIYYCREVPKLPNLSNSNIEEDVISEMVPTIDYNNDDLEREEIVDLQDGSVGSNYVTDQQQREEQQQQQNTTTNCCLL